MAAGRYGTLRTVHVYNVPNFVTVRQPAAELLRFVEKFKMASSAILILYLAFWTTHEVHLWA